jgi:hypothetical protein
MKGIVVLVVIWILLIFIGCLDIHHALSRQPQSVPSGMGKEDVHEAWGH